MGWDEATEDSLRRLGCIESVGAVVLAQTVESSLSFLRVNITTCLRIVIRPVLSDQA